MKPNYDVENRYRVVRHGYWWRVAIGDGQQVVGRCYTKTEAQRLAAALLTAFRDGEFFAQTKPQGEVESLRQQLDTAKAVIEHYSVTEDADGEHACCAALIGKPHSDWCEANRVLEELK